jgi:nucleotide-binding universal stress UspA family protein
MSTPLATSIRTASPEESGAFHHAIWMHDLSPRADACRPAIVALMESSGEVSIVHATGVFPADHGPVSDEARSVLGPRVSTLAEHGLSAELRIEGGSPSDICASITSADLVVAGATGVSGLDRVLVGSEATRLVRGARLPTLVVGRSFDELRHIVCPVSPDEPDLAAVRVAASLAVRHGAQLDLIAVEPAGSGTEDLPGAIAAVRHALEGAADLIAAVPNHTVRAVLGESVLHGILIASRGADLIVIGSHGRTGFSRWLFGSTAEDLVREGQRSVLVIPPAR